MQREKKLSKKHAELQMIDCAAHLIVFRFNIYILGTCGREQFITAP